MTFGMDYGECFAMLGVNGSGKSTTFKCLTNEFHPTKGSLTINGLNVQRDFSKVRSMIGYCPQYDSIFDWMSVEEHLWFYAKIKGIPTEFRADLIERQITEMNLQDHKFKAAGTLSGGNKRKLSVAIAILGNPPIVLLDEPSAGMDPEARRFMWSVVSKISQNRKKSAVILTTHAMDEAEALSTKMGIMVKGGIFKCLGSSSHIKEKYGTGYEIEIKVKKLTDQDIGRKLQQLQLRPNDHFTVQELSIILRRGRFNTVLADQINEHGLGADLFSEYIERGKVTAINFINWLYIEENGLSVIDRISQSFQKVDILEHYNDYYKLRVPRGQKSIGYLFGLIETLKDQFCISEYSVGQTTLEQIFQQFANQRADECSQAKFSFELIGEHALLVGGGSREKRFEILNIEDQGENMRASDYQQGRPTPHFMELNKQTSTMTRVISALSAKQDTKTVTITQSDLDLDEQVVAERVPQTRSNVKAAAIPDFLEEEDVFK